MWAHYITRQTWLSDLLDSFRGGKVGSSTLIKASGAKSFLSRQSLLLKDVHLIWCLFGGCVQYSCGEWTSMCDGWDRDVVQWYADGSGIYTLGTSSSLCSCGCFVCFRYWSLIRSGQKCFPPAIHCFVQPLIIKCVQFTTTCHCQIDRNPSKKKFRDWVFDKPLRDQTQWLNKLDHWAMPQHGILL
jgi:hypothetical protein